MEKDKKVQLRLYPAGKTGRKRIWKLQYRINPSDLKWYQKIFNTWTTLYRYDWSTNVWVRVIVFDDQDPKHELNKYKEQYALESDIKKWNDSQKELFDRYKYKHQHCVIY